MKTFKIPCTWECYGLMKIEAETLEEAIQKAIDDEPLPPGDFVDGSFEVNHDCMELFNKE